MLQRLSNDESTPRRGMEPEPGWLTKRRRGLRPASEVLADLPSGPVIESESGPADAGHHGHDVEAVS
jgi:hypothetical protein